MHPAGRRAPVAPARGLDRAQPRDDDLEEGRQVGVGEPEQHVPSPRVRADAAQSVAPGDHRRARHVEVREERAVPAQ